jgi:hypothetical protein
MANVDELLQVLQWIGIPSVADCQKIKDEIAEDLSDFKLSTKEDIDSAINNLVKAKTVANRVSIPQRARKSIIALMHWVQDFYRCGQLPTIAHLHTEAEFKTKLNVAAERASIRAHKKSQSAALALLTDPGLLKGNTVWVAWLESQENHLSACFGVNGNPMTYLIRKEDIGDPNAVYDSFDHKAVACCPLSGPTFEADAATLHQKMIGWTQGQDSFQFIKSIKKMNNGRLDQQALEEHYDGAGNLEIHLKKAKQLQETLHYKNEKVMKFDTFLGKIQEMSNIFEECKQPLYPDAKLEFLLDRIQSSELNADISTMRAKKGEGNCTYKFAANFLSGRAVATSTAPGGGRSLSSMKTSSEGKCPDKGIYSADGSIFTGKYSPNSAWGALSNEEKKKIYDARPPKGGGGKKWTPNLSGRKVKALKKKNDKKVSSLTKEIAAMKRTVSEMTSSKETPEDDTTPNDQAGNAFGGRSEKQKKVKRK